MVVSCIPESCCCSLFVPLFFFFIFLSNFQVLKKNLVTLFSGTGRPRRLELGTHIDSGQMYRVYRNQAATLIFPYFIIFLFVTLFSGTVRPRRLKLGAHVDSGQIYSVYRNQVAAANSSLPFFIFLSNFQILKFFIKLFSGTVMPRRLKLVAHVDSEWLYRVYRNHAAALYLSLYFFFHFSFQFSSIKKKLGHTFLRNWEA